MSDSFATVTEESWLSRLGGAIKGVLVGLVLFALAFPLLFWNEGRAVKTYRALKEGAGACVSADAAAVNPANDGKLIHVSGRAATQETPSDETFALTAKAALRLERKVEMYQWREKNETKSEKNLGGGKTKTTTTTYEKTWSDSPIASRDFKQAAEHQNPAAFPVSAASRAVAHATLGAYELNSGQIARIEARNALLPENTAAFKLPDELKAKAKIADGYVYFGKNAAAPEVGDLRVSFRTAPAGDVSVIAAQHGNSFRPYTTSNDQAIDLLKEGMRTAPQMFAAAQSENRILTWILRFVGFVVMAIGISMLLRPLSILADVIPFLGSIAEVGLGFIAMVGAATCSLMTIAVAWIYYRPVLGVTLLLLAAGLIYWICRRRSTARSSMGAAVPASA